MEFVFRFILVGLLAAICDVFWTLYFIEVEKRNATMSAVWSSLIMLAGGITIINYSNNPYLILGAVLGAFVGTYFTVKFKK